MEEEMRMNKCFLCQKEIGIGISGERKLFACNDEQEQENHTTFLLCEILEIPRLRKKIQNISEIINYCRQCKKKILNIQYLSDELEKLEREVIHEKYQIELQLKETSQNCNVNLNDTKLRNPLEQLRTAIVKELRARTINSALTTIRRKQVCGRKSSTKNSKTTKVKLRPKTQNIESIIPENNSDHSNSNQNEIDPVASYLDENDDDVQMLEIPLKLVEVVDLDTANASPQNDNIEVDTDVETTGFMYNTLIPNGVFSSENEQKVLCTNTQHDFTGEAHENSLPDNNQEEHSNLIQTGEEIYRGPTCSEEFSIQTEVKNHKKKRQKKKYKCRYCKKKYKNILIHELKHKENIVSNCEYCGKSIKGKKKIQLHQDRFHVKEIRPYKCQTCYIRFRFEKELEKHEINHVHDKPLDTQEMYHTEEICYICRYCSKPYLTKKHCQDHEQTHTSKAEKSIKCKYCVKSFAFKKACRNHELMAHGKHFQCQFCNRHFSTEIKCQNHESSTKAHAEKPFECRYHCGKSFTNLSQQENHECVCPTGKNRQ